MTTPDHRPYLTATDLRTQEDVLAWLIDYPSMDAAQASIVQPESDNCSDYDSDPPVIVRKWCHSGAHTTPMVEEVLTIKDIAEILKLAEKTVYSMASSGELPAFKIRGQWRVRRADFERWMTDKASNRAKSDEDEA